MFLFTFWDAGVGLPIEPRLLGGEIKALSAFNLSLPLSATFFSSFPSPLPAPKQNTFYPGIETFSDSLMIDVPRYVWKGNPPGDVFPFTSLPDAILGKSYRVRLCQAVRGLSRASID